MTEPRQRQIWMLRLVPAMRFGRWLTAGLILAGGAIVYGIAAWLVAANPALHARFFGWAPATFFVVSVAYIVPVFHYVMQRSHQALEELAPYLGSADVVASLHLRIDHRPMLWTFRTTLVGLLLWLLQGRLLVGSWSRMIERSAESFVAFVMDFGPVFVWVVMTVTVRALFENAQLFRRLAGELKLDVFNPATFTPIGQMAVYSTLTIVGAIALFPVMWMDGQLNWWTTLPGVFTMSPFIILLLLLPVLPLHRRMRAQKRAAIADVQREINEQRAEAAGQLASEQLRLLALRREIAALPAWPFDVSAVARFAGYAVIVPLTWAGAALIEMLVNVMLE